MQRATMAHELTDGDWERIAEFAKARRYDRNPDMLRPGAEGDEYPEENPLE